MAGFFGDIKEKIGKDIEGAKKGDLKSLAKVGTGIGTMGQSYAVEQGLEETGVKDFNKVDVAQTESDYVPLTDAQKEEMRKGLAAQPGQVDKILDPTNLQKVGPQASALGKTYAENVGQVDLAALPGLARTTVAAPGTRQVTQMDTSNIRNAPVIDTSGVQPVTYNAGAIDTSGIAFDPNNVRQGQAYTGAPNASQQFLTNVLTQQAQGQGPSVAAAQFKAANEANLAASLAQQASLRGGFDPAAARQIRQTAADLQAKAAQDAAQAKIQEQLSAQQQLASVAATTEQQKATAGSQSLAQQETDVQTQTAAANVAATKAGLDKGIQDQISSIAAGNSDRALELQKVVADTELAARGQDINIEQFQANLADKATLEEYEANLRTGLAQADITSGENKLVYDTNVRVALENEMQKNDALKTIYNGDMTALKMDVDAANSLIREALSKKVSIMEAQNQLEAFFIQDGINAEEAKIRAKNGIAVAATAASNTTRRAQEALVIKGVSTAAQVGATAATGGMAPVPAPV